MSPKKLHENLEIVRAKPFTISLSDGRRLVVPHTDYLMLTKSAGQVILLEHGESLKIIDTAHITSIDLDVLQRRRAEGK